MVELGLPLAMQISITVDLISKKISLYAELTTVETISPEIALLQQHLYSNVNSVSNLNPIKIRRKLVWPQEILFRMFDDDMDLCSV